MSSEGHPSWGKGATIEEKRKTKKLKAKESRKIDDLIEWLEALEEELEFLKHR